MSTKRLRELDAWIAERVTKRGTGLYYCSGCRQCVPVEEVTSGGYHGTCKVGGRIDNGIPNYSCDNAAAMEVLKKCAEKADQISIVECEGTWAVCVGDGNHLKPVPEGEAETLELAICLFAKALFT